MMNQQLLQRANHQCELCLDKTNLSVYHVEDSPAKVIDNWVVLCSLCLDQIQGGAEWDNDRWNFLELVMWSEVPAVKILTYRILGELDDLAHFQELKEQMYLEEDEVKWSYSKRILKKEKQGLADTHRDSLGAELFDGDSVTLTKDLDVSGAGFTAKRGSLVKGIRLTIGNPEHIEAKVQGVQIVILTKYTKKA